MQTIDNMQDIVDSRDIIERIEELEDIQQGHIDDDTIDDWENTDDCKELDTLRELATECEGSSDWNYDGALIRNTYFQEYAQTLAEDCYDIPDSDIWPYRCIDWDQVANELKMNYIEVDFDGIAYYIRY